jgi:hypothetical protein
VQVAASKSGAHVADRAKVAGRIVQAGAESCRVRE